MAAAQRSAQDCYSIFQEMAYKEQVAILKKGASAWNAYRAKNPKDHSSLAPGLHVQRNPMPKDAHRDDKDRNTPVIREMAIPKGTRQGDRCVNGNEDIENRAARPRGITSMHVCKFSVLQCTVPLDEHPGEGHLRSRQSVFNVNPVIPRHEYARVSLRKL